jgi:hypothetical protein
MSDDAIIHAFRKDLPMATASFKMAMSHSNDEDLHLLFHPNRRYDRPADVLVDPALSLDQRRAILSSWASDACAVECAPALRRPPFAAEPVSFGDIMDALLQLDRLVTDPQRKTGGAYQRPENRAADERRLS